LFNYYTVVEKVVVVKLL